MVFVWILQGTVVKYSEVSKERTATIFSVTEIDAAAIWKNNFVSVCPRTNMEGAKRA
jgi:hypothetical protein